MNHQDPVVIVAAKRSPIGAFQGQLATLRAPEIASQVIKALYQMPLISPDAIEEVILGLCLFAGVKQAPSRQAALLAGLPDQVACTTLSKMCGSGMKAMMVLCDQIISGNTQVGIAGGMESMTNAPYLVPKARSGYRLGHGQLLDHMFTDGLEDAYEGHLMGYYADNIAKSHKISRLMQDDYAAESVRRAQTAVQSGAFKDEIVPICIDHKGKSSLMEDDETPGKCDIHKIPQLKPAFSSDGTVTAANASSISDGAAALMLMRQSQALALGLVPLAKIVGHATVAQAPHLFATSPIYAIQRLLEKLTWKIEDVDLFEINEAFAVVSLLAMQALHIPHHKVNVHGGACALGHPIGASGARIVVSLLYALKQRGLKRGIASICIGGGEATSLAIELI